MIGGRLYFSADDGVHGHEPWWLLLPPASNAHDPQNEDADSGKANRVRR